MMSRTAVILMSGGMDSTVCAAIAIAEGFTPAGMHLNYRQRTAAREGRAFGDVCDFLGIEQRLVADTAHLSAIGGSSLTDTAIPVNEADPDATAIPSSYVPFRNANILAMAVAWAEVLQAGALFIGAVEEDSSGYPDCRKEFFAAFQQTIDTGTRPETDIRIHTPLIALSKADIVRRGIELGAPLHLSWSCYQNSERACGRCDSCNLRLRGFREAGRRDPLAYESAKSRSFPTGR